MKVTKEFTWKRFTELFDFMQELEMKHNPTFKVMSLAMEDGKPYLLLENPTTGTQYHIRDKADTAEHRVEIHGVEIHGEIHADMLTPTPTSPNDFELYEQKVALRKIPRGDELTVCVVDPLVRKLQLYHKPTNYFFEVQLCSEAENKLWDELHVENHSMRKRVEELEHHLMELEHVEKERVQTEELLETLTRQRDDAEREVTQLKEQLASVMHDLKKNQELYKKQTGEHRQTKEMLDTVIKQRDYADNALQKSNENTRIYMAVARDQEQTDLPTHGQLDAAENMSWDEFRQLTMTGNPRLRIHPANTWPYTWVMFAEDSRGRQYLVNITDR